MCIKMKNKSKMDFKIIKQIYSNKKYIIISVTVSILTFIALYYLTFYYTTPRALRSTEGLFYFYFTFVSNFIIALLFGFNVSIILHNNKIKNNLVKESSLSGSGTLAAAFASGCPVCGSLLLPLIGISGGLAAFPLRGLELKALALSLMLISTYFILKNNNKCELCENVEVKNETQ